MITHGLRTLLLAQSSITALAPSQTVNRVSIPSVFVKSAPMKVEPPFVVITRINNDTMVCLDGTYGMTASEIDIDSYGYSEEDSQTLSTTIRQFLDDYTGAAGGSDTINAVVWQDENHEDVKPQDGRDTRWYISTNSYLIQHS